MRLGAKCWSRSPATAGPVTVLRDYHAENVMLVDGRGGIERFGLLDFQDALAGHPAYDLVSVLEDARRDVPPELEREMIDRYRRPNRCRRAVRARPIGRSRRSATPASSASSAGLWKRDGKDRYKAFQPRMWGLLERDLAQPGLEPVRDWFDANVPASARAAAWQEQPT